MYNTLAKIIVTIAALMLGYSGIFFSIYEDKPGLPGHILPLGIGGLVLFCIGISLQKSKNPTLTKLNQESVRTILICMGLFAALYGLIHLFAHSMPQLLIIGLVIAMIAVSGYLIFYLRWIFRYKMLKANVKLSKYDEFILRNSPVFGIIISGIIIFLYLLFSLFSLFF